MTLEFRADLHCHSTSSDGSDTPQQLVRKAKEIGLSGLSITDHDTIEAYRPELLSEAEALGLQILTGIELSSEFGETPVHILGYGFDLHSDSLRIFLVEMQKRRNQRNRALLEKLAERNLPIAEEELLDFARHTEKKKTVGRPHIAALMVKKGYVRTLQEAFDRYLKEGGLCYVPGFKFTPQDAIDEIRKAGGKAVLAHPHFIKKGSLLRKLLEHRFDGIECYYGNLHKQLEAPWLKIAKEKNWIATGGSDYHGTFKPHISLGCSWVGEAAFHALQIP